MITNREIGKLARAICKREGLKYGVRTNSYSEYRGGRRVKKYWMAFDSKRIANIFLEEVKPYGINPISKGYSYRIGYIVEIIKEVEEKTKPKKKIAIRKEDLNYAKYGCRFEPKYDKNGDYRPNQIEVSEEEVSIVMDEILFQIWSKSSVFLEVSDDGKMPFFYQQEVDDLKELSEALKEVTENRILKMTHYVRYWIADDLYGARKCWKSYLKSVA